MQLVFRFIIFSTFLCSSWCIAIAQAQGTANACLYAYPDVPDAYPNGGGNFTN